MSTRSITVKAPAKVNLFLGVGGLQDDGYHAVTTVLHTLELSDEIEIVESTSLCVNCEPDVGVPAEDNLAWRAAERLGRALGREPRVSITVRKRIPHGAGLGGGSSDAAAVIAGLADLWGLDPRDPACVSVAASLGADVPFFLGRTGCALMAGRGDEFVEELASIPGLPVCVVKPHEPVATAAAYAAFDADPQAPGSPDAVLAALAAQDVRALAASMSNNMEKVACTLVPELARVFGWAGDRSGVMRALLAGSGSAVVCLCDSLQDASQLASEAQGLGWWANSTRLASGGVTVEGR